MVKSFPENKEGINSKSVLYFWEKAKAKTKLLLYYYMRKHSD